MIANQCSDAVLFCHDAVGGHWQLGHLPPHQGTFALIGWTISDNSGEPPRKVTGALARAFTGYGRVTFPRSSATAQGNSGWVAQNGDYVDAFPSRAIWEPGGLLSAFRAPKELILLSTVREDAVRHMFNDAAYPWWLQGQFALLSRPAIAPPDLSKHRELLFRLIEPDWADVFFKLKASGLDAIFRPGVDGSVAGLLCRSPDVLREIEDCIRRSASEIGLTCHLFGEAAFQKSLSEGTGTSIGTTF